MIPTINIPVREQNTKSIYNLFDSYKAIAIDNSGLINLNRYEFHERLHLILSEAILLDNLKLLSREQYTIVMRYFTQADNVIDNDTSVLDNDIRQLDEFLGGLINE